MAEAFQRKMRSRRDVRRMMRNDSVAKQEKKKQTKHPKMGEDKPETAQGLNGSRHSRVTTLKFLSRPDLTGWTGSWWWLTFCCVREWSVLECRRWGAHAFAPSARARAAAIETHPRLWPAHPKCSPIGHLPLTVSSHQLSSRRFIFKRASCPAFSYRRPSPLHHKAY